MRTLTGKIRLSLTGKMRYSLSGKTRQSLTGKIHHWMEQNLEDPFVRAEMARAEPTGKTSGASTVVYVSVALGLVTMICWLFASMA